MPAKGTVKCRSCDKYVSRDESYWPDGGSIDPDLGPLCETCYSEDEEVFTIHFFMPDGSEEKWGIGHVTLFELQLLEEGLSDSHHRPVHRGGIDVSVKAL